MYLDNLTKLSLLLVASFALAAVPATAQVSAGATELEIRDGALTIVNPAAVWVSGDDKVGIPDDISGEFEAPDESGKGTATVVTYAANPEWFGNKELCLTGVGIDWAGDRNVDRGKLQCAPITGSSVTIPFEAAGAGVFGLVPLIVQGNRIVAWGSHPFGPTRYTMRRPDGTRDIITLLATPDGRTLQPASQAQADKYQGLYASMFR